MKKLLFFIIAMLIMSGSSIYADSIGYTNISDIALYKNSNYSSNISDVLDLNTRLEIIKEKNEWYNVKTSKGSSGWIEKYFVTVPAQKFVSNNTGYNVNIRTSPTTLSKTVGQLKPGEKAKYIDTYHSWHIIEYKGKEYYIASWLADIEYEASQEIYLLYDKINIREKAGISSNVLAQGIKLNLMMEVQAMLQDG